jgi:nitronate monooxygenase
MAIAKELRDRLTLPAFAAPMFLCSGVALAAACCQAGIIGSLTRNHCRDLEELEVQLKSVREALERFADESPESRVGPLAVNISPTFS